MTQLSTQTQRHLRTVYQNLSIQTLVAALACYLLNRGIIAPPGFLATIMLFGTLMAAVYYPNRPENSFVRNVALYGFGFAEGWIMGPLVNTVLWIEPNTVLITLVATALIFLAFTGSAIYSPRRQYLYLGGLLGTLMCLMMLGSLANVFIGSSAMLSAELYLGLFLFSLYVLYDTQVIIERSEGGNRDPVLHTIMLFTDFAAIFGRLLIILSRDRENGDRDGGRRRRGQRK